jgi:hypothetical protein
MKKFMHKYKMILTNKILLLSLFIASLIFIQAACEEVREVRVLE